jgi:hypothetical protein
VTDGSDVSTSVGFSGHQRLSEATAEAVEACIRTELAGLELVTGLTSLAEGSDQIFARVVLGMGGRLIVVVPSRAYESTFDERSGDAYRRFRSLAAEVVELPFDKPTEDAFFAAGKTIVKRCDRLLAVWDGKPARGVGGTADVVDYAVRLGKQVQVVWPVGAERQ